MIDAPSPRASASIITEPSTWRRAAPTMRSIANSRVRWATVIESVLKIVNAPTRTATPPNTSRTVLMMPMNFFSPSSVKRSCAAAVWTWRSAPTAAATARADVGRGGAGAARDEDRVVAALLVEQLLRGREVEHGGRGGAERLDRAEAGDADDRNEEACAARGDPHAVGRRV